MNQDKRKVILINCSLSYQHEALKYPPFPTTAIMLMATVLHHAGWEVCILDGNLYDMDAFKRELERHIDKSILYVGLSVMTCQIPWAYQVCQHIKSLAPDVPIVWGGVHPTFFPGQTVDDPCVDIVVINEALKETILPLTTAIHEQRSMENIPGLCYKHQGRTVQTKPSGLDDIQNTPLVDFSLMDHRKYAVDNFLWHYYPEHIPKVKNITYPIVTGLGCAHKCNFCINVILQRRYRKRSAAEIVDRIEFLQKQYGATFIQFLDEDFLISKARILEFLDLVEERRLVFYYRAWLRVDYFRDDYINVDLAKRLHKNGLLIAVMGAESGSQDTLNHLKKGITPEQIMRAADTLRQTEIIPRFSFMAGLPGETKKDLKLTKKICKKLRKNPRADVPVINFRPYPGSPLYDEIKRDHFLTEPESLYEWSLLNAAKGHGYFSIEDSPWIQAPKLVKKMISV